MSEPLSGRRILVCVTASIAAYKSVYLIRELIARGAFVSVALTPSAKRFVGTETFSALASEPAYDDLFDSRGAIAHTTLGRNADLVIVVPATATTIAKMSNGIGDDIVTATLLCTPNKTPVVVAPAMHEEMYDNPATQKNIEQLTSRGMHFIGPVDGTLAGGDSGRGRLVEPQEIADTIVEILRQKPQNDRGSHPESNSHSERSEESAASKATVLITAGGTREPIDPVRVITNRSSGKMGHALANAARAMGYRVILITSSSLPTIEGVERVDVETAAQMHEQVMKYLDQTDIAIFAAAVADITPAHPSFEKIKREVGITTIDVIPTEDIVADVVADGKDIFTVCFAAETENVVENAQKKYAAKGVNLLFANDVSATDIGFDSDMNTIWVVGSTDKPREIGPLPKEVLAYELMDVLERVRASL
jgi:phosphopantothenoylcysteine decarboxylase/phosphopantothenate--cysteine ligase